MKKQPLLSINNTVKVLICLIVFYCAPYNIEARAVLSPIKASGVVDRNQIGGQGLHVVSVWDSRPVSAVSEDGSFVTVISNQRPQKIALVDSKGYIRALAISLPDKPDSIRFDADSTAKAILFQDSAAFGMDTGKFFASVENKTSFKKLVTFLKNNLTDRPLEQLNDDKEYLGILDECNNDIFGQDQQAVMDSLDNAKARLRELLE